MNPKNEAQARRARTKVSPKKCVVPVSVLNLGTPSVPQPLAAGWVDLWRALTSSPLAAVWTVFVLACTIWQPFRLGFYLDDWAVILEQAAQVPFSTGLLHMIMFDSDTSRPGILPVRFLLCSVLRGNPVMWQMALLAGNLLVSILLMRVVQLLGTATGRTCRVCAYSVGLCWLLLPWNAASSFWPVLLVVVLLMAIFGGIIVLLLAGWNGSIRANIVACTAYLYLCVSYEAFYFQFIPLIAIGIVLNIRKAVCIRTVAHSAGGLLLAQALAIAWYFHLAEKGAQRPIESTSISILLHNLLHIRSAIAESLGQLAPVFWVALVGGALVLIGGLLWVPARKNLWGHVALVFIAANGGLLSLVAFSLGGRVLMGKGVETRILILLSFWMIVAVGLLASAAHVSLWRPAGIALVAFGTVMGGALGVAHSDRAREWASAWDAQKRILSRAPVNSIENTEADAAIVFINPRTIAEAPVFAASWDLNHAMPLTFGNQVRRNYVVYNPWSGPLIWNGSELAYGREEMQRAARVYVWKPADGTLIRAASPFRVNQDLTVTQLANR